MYRGERKIKKRKKKKEKIKKKEETRVNGANERRRRNGGSLEVARKDCRREKRAGSRPGAGLLSLTEVPNTCGITGAGQVHRWWRKTKVFSTREPQDGILLRATDTQPAKRSLGKYSRVTHRILCTLFQSILDNRSFVYDLRSFWFIAVVIVVDLEFLLKVTELRDRSNDTFWRSIFFVVLLLMVEGSFFFIPL